MTAKIIYTETDEAPALATYSLLPIIQTFTAAAGVDIETSDISLAARILSKFPEVLTQDQQVPDNLAALGELVKQPHANVIKLPNISASIPQLNQTIAELQSQGFNLPDYPPEPHTDEERDIKARYATALGSAVNPVLREGNSDRRVASAVKEYARANPHSMGDWSADSKSRVAHMNDGDFYSSEDSAVMAQAGDLRIELHSEDGEVTVLRDAVPVQTDEVVDAAVMNVAALRTFFAGAIDKAHEEGVLLSLHLKATMMKVSDPIMFGHAVTTFYQDAFTANAERFEELRVNPKNGIGDAYKRIADLPADEREAIEADIESCYASRPELAMVDSDKGITNLHVPSNVIIDASMPAAIRTSGQMWGPDGKLADTLAIIPDRSYAGIYQEVMTDCRRHGAFDVTTMGNVCNVGLMAQKAQEYGSHDKTFEIPAAGKVKVVDSTGQTVFTHAVERGDIWRMCQTRDLPIRDWVRLGVKRARDTGDTAIFWLDPQRAHDRQLMVKVETYLADHDTDGLDIRMQSPVEAMKTSLALVREGKNAISVTGNVLRDYLTDLFPILELGTSAKMLSIVPLLAGGGLYETGAGGSAPKHVQQFMEEGHLRWDSLGEYLALAVSLQELAEHADSPRAKVLGHALDQANNKFLLNSKSPSRKVGELDTRGSHFYLALYWAQALAEQDDDAGLQQQFSGLADALAANEETIVNELNNAQGQAMEIGGYYNPDRNLAAAAMRPSETFNRILGESGQA